MVSGRVVVGVWFFDGAGATRSVVRSGLGVRLCVGLKASESVG